MAVEFGRLTNGDSYRRIGENNSAGRLGYLRNSYAPNYSAYLAKQPLKYDSVEFSEDAQKYLEAQEENVPNNVGDMANKVANEIAQEHQQTLLLFSETLQEQANSKDTEGLEKAKLMYQTLSGDIKAKADKYGFELSDAKADAVMKKAFKSAFENGYNATSDWCDFEYRYNCHLLDMFIKYVK